MREAIHDANATESSVRAAAKKVGEVKTGLAVKRFKIYGKRNPILTAEQRDKLKKFEGRMDDFVDSAIKRRGERRAE